MYSMESSLRLPSFTSGVPSFASRNTESYVFRFDEKAQSLRVFENGPRGS